ncbi:hypothetical protein [Agrobacterium pusense]|uniref:hypothetical protein n=1 Tax=Agrobacterium pusense TaxID=648995 RepID=UPI00130089CF|nr:hypothetical protein [Agrobacterium pusense]
MASTLAGQPALPSKAEVVNYFAALKSNAQTSWLDGAHPRQDGELPSRLSTLSPAQKIALVSVRGPLHCADGWSYLSQAMRALFSGHAHTCRHLAYYAELRAALSVLATQGVCIGKKYHFCVDATGNVHAWEGQGTHEEVWSALTEWAGFGNSFEEIMTALKIAGVSLDIALKTFFPVLPSAQLGTQLIKSWGYDLSNGRQDRTTRNISSYGVNDLTSLPISVEKGYQLARTVWEAIAPVGNSLEAYLLKSLLRDQIRKSGDTYLPHYKSQYDKLDPRIKRHFEWKFVTAPLKRSVHPIFGFANDHTQPSRPEAVLSRALLLLRLATSMNNQNFEAAGLQTIEDLQFWWPSYGAERGFYDPMMPPDELSDLWSDVEIALGDLVNPAPATPYEFARLDVSSFNRIWEADRSVLWALIK